MKKNNYLNGDKMNIDRKKERYSDTTPLVIHLLDQGYTHREIKHLTGLSICTISRDEEDH